MTPSWHPSNASRDAQQIWDDAAADAAQFIQLLESDGLLPQLSGNFEGLRIV
jgi:hypothetical protein